MSKVTTPISVLTGDLVESTALDHSQISQAFAALQDCAHRQAVWMGAPLHFSRHRGDGWQVVLAKPHLALRSAIAFRATLRAKNKAFDSYIGIAEGENSEVLSQDLNNHTGPVFVASGQALDDLKKTLAPVRMVHDSLGAKDAAVILADRMIQQWTQAQSAAMSLALSPATPMSFTDIATKLGKSRQAVTKALKAAGLDHLDLALETIDRSAIQ